MTKVILHIGQHKTGSTALQYTLAANRRRLQENGVLYPRLPGWTFAHHALFPHFFGVEHCDPFILRRLGSTPAAATAVSREAWKHLVSQVQREQPDCLLLSSESFFTSARTEQMQTLGNMLREITDETEIVCYLRHPADFVLSSLSTQVQMDARFLWPAPGVRREVIEAYEALQPSRIHVIKYDRSGLLGGDIVGDFMHRFVGTGVELPSGSRVNTSLSAEAIVVMDRFVTGNRSSRDRPMPYRQQVFRRILKYVDRATPGFRKPELLPAVKQSILQGCSDLDWLECSYGIKWPCESPASSRRSEVTRYGDTLSPLNSCHIDAGRLQNIDRLMSLVSVATRPMGDFHGWR